MSRPTETVLPFHIEFDRETDGRWIAEIPELSGVMVYGRTKGEAQRRVLKLALDVLPDLIEECYRSDFADSLLSYGVARR